MRWKRQGDRAANRRARADVIGECLCRRVRVEIDAPPAYINICNCKFCRKSGAAWGYFPSSAVKVSGATVGFSRDDIGEVWLVGHFCPSCGATTHYTASPDDPSERVGVNTRLFAQDDLDGIEVKFQDGRAVDTEDDDFIVTARGHIGDGTAF